METNYQNPPIKVRSFEASARLESADFERFAPGWLQQVANTQAYPKQEMRQHWDFFIRQDKRGVPVPKGVLTNVPRLYAEAANGRLSRSIELYPPKEDAIGKIVFTLYRPTHTVTRYTELRNEVGKWLHDWMDTVRSSGFGEIRLRYDNELAAKEYSSFWGQKGLELGKILNFFSKNPAPVGQFRPPFRTELNLLVDESGPNYMRTVLTSALPDTNIFRVTFEYIANRKTFDRSVDDCLLEMDRGHDLILDHFEKHFTKEALNVFK